MGLQGLEMLHEYFCLLHVRGLYEGNTFDTVHINCISCILFKAAPAGSTVSNTITIISAAAIAATTPQGRGRAGGQEADASAD
jgi:hypothetical protein